MSPVVAHVQPGREEQVKIDQLPAIQLPGTPCERIPPGADQKRITRASPASPAASLHLDAGLFRVEIRRVLLGHPVTIVVFFDSSEAP